VTIFLSSKAVRSENSTQEVARMIERDSLTLTLKGRQRAFAGVGRLDLFFQDEYQTNILMELQARPAKYEDATQVAKYKEELQRRGETNILMWLVTPQMDSTVGDETHH
jgi:hypothetical protein